MLDIIDKHIGTMREATSEERQNVDDYIDSISTTVDLEAIRQEIEDEIWSELDGKRVMEINGKAYLNIVDVIDIIDKHLQNPQEQENK